MNSEALKSIMNPVRIKIIQELSMKGTATTKEIASACGEIPQATLYRHLSNLMKNGVITVLSENRIRGTLEKVYAIKENPSQTINNKLETLTKDDLSDLFIQFIVSLLTDYNACMSQEIVMKELGSWIGFRSCSLLLTNEELLEMLIEVNKIIIERLANKAAPNRKLRKFSTIVTTALHK